MDAIATMAGFNDRHSFLRAFKKTTGLSPSDFRKSLN
jgi:AraC-like DNA-binding protein